MNSAVYRGWVRHRRRSPVENEFRYSVFMLYLDLAELPTLFDPVPLFSYERCNVACWRRKDYHGDAATPLDTAVRDTVERELKRRPSGPIRMLTHARYWGYCFNPVTFYYCLDESDTRVDAIVAEITNTPWGERRAYVLDAAEHSGADATHMRWRFPKDFHVSPFIGMDVEYDWRFRQPGEELNVHMRDLSGGDCFFDATLHLERQAWTRGALLRALAWHPCMSVKVITLIHWQALRLWWRGAPWVDHPDVVTEGSDVQ